MSNSSITLEQLKGEITPLLKEIEFNFAEFNGTDYVCYKESSQGEDRITISRSKTLLLLAYEHPGVSSVTLSVYPHCIKSAYEFLGMGQRTTDHPDLASGIEEFSGMIRGVYEKLAPAESD